jgi:transcription initiation factor TFIIIB Brf1 subunit/transcription initiation factor TFIIB
MARPLAPISAEQVFRMAKLGMTQAEIAEVYDVDQSTISKRFSSEFASARGQWKMSLRRAQSRRAIKDGSDAMLIHLGKTYLGQTDRLDITSHGESVTTVMHFEDNGFGGTPDPAHQGAGGAAT